MLRTQVETVSGNVRMSNIERVKARYREIVDNVCHGYCDHHFHLGHAVAESWQRGYPAQRFSKRLSQETFVERVTDPATFADLQLAAGGIPNCSDRTFFETAGTAVANVWLFENRSFLNAHQQSNHHLTSGTIHGAGQDDVRRNMLVCGDQMFLVTLRERTVVSGRTGVTAGPGVDTATRLGMLDVVHMVTTYTGEGVTAGSSFVSGDTIVGVSGTHTLHVK